LCISRPRGFRTGRADFDAKVCHESTEPVDLFHAHIGGMDAFARGLKTAHAIIADGRLAGFVKERYKSWESELGKRIERGKAWFAELEAYLLPKGDAAKKREREAGDVGEFD
jgi:xylose isomerase